MRPCRRRRTPGHGRDRGGDDEPLHGVLAGGVEVAGGDGLVAGGGGACDQRAAPVARGAELQVALGAASPQHDARRAPAAPRVPAGRVNPGDGAGEALHRRVR